MSTAAEDRTGAVLGGLGAAFAGVLFLSPTPLFRKLYKAQPRSTEGYDCTPFVVSALQSALWIFYAVVVGNRFAALVTNLFGFAIEATYCALFHHCTVPERRRRQNLQILGAALYLLFAVLVVLLALQKSRHELGAGLLADFANVAMFGSPLLALAEALRRRDTSKLPLPLSLAIVACASIWAAYGGYKGKTDPRCLLIRPLTRRSGDPFIIVPNVMGAALGVLQVGLFFVIAARERGRLQEEAAARGEGPEGAESPRARLLLQEAEAGASGN
jgi:hypothetical protein